jgi:hypothetical protein
MLKALPASLSLLLGLATTSTAFAQAPGAQPAAPAAQQPAPPPAGTPYSAPPSAMAPGGQYVAPPYQTPPPYYLPQNIALQGPRMITDWQEGEPVPYGYHRSERTRRGPLISGAILFGVTYLYSAFFASIGDDLSDGGTNQLSWLYVPVIGPFAEISRSTSATANYVLVLDGLAQATGAALFIYALSSPMPVLVRNDLAMVTVTPTFVGKDGTGMAVAGRF